jgi:hypothetical protein
MFEDNREETKSIPNKQASPKHRDAMGDTNNQQVNVKLKLENGNVQGEGRGKDENIYIALVAVLVVERQPSTSLESQKRKRKTYVPKVFIMIFLKEIRVCSLMGFGWMAFCRKSM